MKYYELLEIIKKGKYRRIIVSGPQRSGTTIAMRCLANDLGFRPVVEEKFNASNIVGFFYCLQEMDIVIQCPEMSFILGEMCEQDMCVVYMIRDEEEIKASEKRVDWDFRMRQVNRYFSYDEAGVNEIKYKAWKEFQQPKLEGRGFELEYSSIKEHPLWICRRKKFHSRQTMNHEYRHSDTEL
jgi:hypothetical protein